MLDTNSSVLLLEAVLADRRRELLAIRRSGPIVRQLPDPRAVLAGALAHLAFHLDRRAVGAVAASHHPSPITHRPKGVAA